MTAWQCTQDYPITGIDYLACCSQYGSQALSGISGSLHQHLNESDNNECNKLKVSIFKLHISKLWKKY